MKIPVKEICEYVEANRDTAIDFLQKMVRIPSITGNEYEICNFLEAWFKENLDLELKIYEEEKGRKNFVVNWYGNQPGERFLFNGHLDEFPESTDEVGLYPPFSGEIKDGYMYGRGSADMKSGLCATIMAVYFLKKMGYVPETGTVSLSCCIDEEDGGPQGVMYMLKQGECEADYGVCAEPTNGRLFVAGGATIWGNVTYKAEAGHPACCPFHIDANRKAIKAINALLDYSDKVMEERFHEELGGGPTMYITVVNGGIASNVCSESCTFHFDRRLVPTESIEGVEKEILNILEKLKAEDPGMDFEYVRECYVPQYNLDRNHKLIKSAMESMEAFTGRKSEFLVRHGGSDTHKIVEKYPKACIPNFGPADEYADGICSANERCNLQTYVDFIKVYMNMVVDLQG